MRSRFKSALTRDQLIEIQARNNENRPRMVLQALRATLKDEPCIQESAKLDRGKP